MVIVVNTRLLLPDKLEGIGWFTHETLRRITQQHPDQRFIFLFDRPYDQKFIYGPNVEPVVMGPPTRHPWLYRLWFEYQVPRVLKRFRADVFLSPDGFLSLRAPAGVKQLAVIHDLNFEHHPADLPKAYSRYYRNWFPRFAAKADRIVTVSEFSKSDIVQRYGIDADRIDVAHNGVGDVFSPLTAEERDTARERFAKGAPYFVCVGAMHPRKNLARTLEAFDQTASTDDQIRLVLVGERMFHDQRMEQVLRTMRHADRVSFTGRLGQRDLRTAIGGALALVYVSYFEGFGIPVAEAMKCGVPVVAAQATSLPEVAGDAAVYADPFSVPSIAEAMGRILRDDALRGRLAELGAARAARFTWDRTADLLWRTLERMMAGR
jgi:glycosyltransferase involved in cell wall biosynthesis